MTEQRERMEKALRRCAEAGVPENLDLWSEIRERTAVKETSGAFRTRFAPRTRMGWAIAILAALFVTTGAGYAATELADEMLRSELPGTPEEEDVGVLIDQRQVADGAAVTLKRAYIDSSYVAVSLVVEDLEKERRLGGRPAKLHPVVAIDELGYERELEKLKPERTKLTDENGNAFRVVDGGGMMSVAPDNIMEGAMPSTAVFTAPESLKPGEKHRLRLEIPLESVAIPSPKDTPEDEVPSEPVGKPFVFKFEVTVRPVPVMKVNQEVEKNGLTLTLDRVVDSPGRPHAVICFEPPDDQHYWGPAVKKSGLTWSEPADGRLETQSTGDGCSIATFSSAARDYSSLIVTEVEGFPKDGDVDGPEDIKTIRGPWVFDFEIPE